MIVICEFMDEAAITEGLRGFDVVYDPGLVDRPDELIETIRGAAALIVRNRTQVRGALLEAATRLRVVGRLGVGLDNIDIDACRSRSITVYPASGANDVSVAEYVIGTAMTLLRGAYSATAEVVAGRWPRNRLLGGREIAGKHLGLVGYGSIARQVARRASALGMHVSAFDPHLAPDDPAWLPDWGSVTPAPLADLLARADVVALHVPLTPDTRGMFGADAIAAMKQGAILINTARGNIVDQNAVAAALISGHLGGAALDVFDAEPLTAEVGAVFRDVQNLILTPHIAGLTEEANLRVSWLTVENVRQHLLGTA